jgi:CII-binding regulator of phage lambda lysogenization HflD
MENNPLIFNIRLNVDQVNVILSTLGKLPYETIAPLMKSIQVQANMQLQEFQQAEAESEAEAEVQTDHVIQ